MLRPRKVGAIGLAAIALSGLLGTTNLTSAQTNGSKPDYTFDPGVVCPGFGLNIYIDGGDNRVSKTFYDRNGNPVRLFEGGRGYQLTFENTSTGALLKIVPNGSVSRTTLNPDGTQTVTTTGHNVIILFGNEPGGPSTIQYVGRLVYTTDSSQVFTIQSFSGKQVDICAALSP